MVSLVSDAEDDVHREVGPLKVTPFKLPDGCIAGYYLNKPTHPALPS